MNEVTKWTFGETEVRTIYVNGETWWVLKDVCSILEIARGTKIAERLDEDEVRQTSLTDSLGREQKTYIVNESGLYSVILRSDKPQARPFRKWVTSEVLPAIRKHGAYLTAEARQAEYIARLEAEAKATRARAMLINAENRRMKMLLSHPEMSKLSSPALETMALKTFEQATGQDVGNALPEVEQTFSATEVGKMLGGISANKIGKTANAHGLKTEKYGVFVMDKSRYSSKEVASFRYNMRGVEKLAEILGVKIMANAA